MQVQVDPDTRRECGPGEEALRRSILRYAGDDRTMRRLRSLVRYGGALQVQDTRYASAFFAQTSRVS